MATVGLGRVVRHPFAVTGSMVVAMAAVTSVFGPDLVTGSRHDHLPLPGLLVWLWAAVAVANVRTTFQAGLEAIEAGRLASTVSSVWVIAALLSTLGPVLVTGTDPTRIPLVALTAPIVATMATSSACIAALARRHVLPR